jgi:hypothetical protein
MFQHDLTLKDDERAMGRFVNGVVFSNLRNQHNHQANLPVEEPSRRAELNSCPKVRTLGASSQRPPARDGRVVYARLWSRWFKLRAILSLSLERYHRSPANGSPSQPPAQTSPT